MNLGELILALKPLLAEPEANAEEIVDLLERHQSLAEFEVARFYVSRAVAPFIEAQTRSASPAQRSTATRGVATMLARTDAARLLRRLVKDADPIVRSVARAGVRRLGLDDVALPDTRFPVPRRPQPLAPGLWNPSGWSFGIYGQRDVRLKRTGKVERPKLPAIADVTQLAAFLGLGSPGELTPLLRAGEGPGAPYVAFEIPKASGGARTIHAPRAALKRVQRKILDGILAHIPAHDACHGFTRRRSTVTNAKPHLRAEIVVRVDLADFFPSIHFRRVEGLFREYGYAPPVARMLAGLTTHRPRLADGTAGWPGVMPQGAPTSPAIANVVCRRLDARLSALAKRAGAKYTRYADDLTFSFAAKPTVGMGRFLWWVDQICQSEGFQENPAKRRVFRRHRQQRVTGIVVNDKLAVPRAARRRFRAMLARCKKEGLASMLAARPMLRAELEGFAAYVKMVQPELGAALAAQIRALQAGAAP
jgi:retron-type reverse transcriptase